MIMRDSDAAAQIRMINHFQKKLKIGYPILPKVKKQKPVKEKETK